MPLAQEELSLRRAKRLAPPPDKRMWLLSPTPLLTRMMLALVTRVLVTGLPVWLS